MSKGKAVKAKIPTRLVKDLFSNPKRTPFLIASFVIVLLVFSYIFYYFVVCNLKPDYIRVTNVTDTSFTVVWITRKASTGEVIVKEKDNFLPSFLAPTGAKTYYDDRDVTRAEIQAGEKRTKDAAEKVKNSSENVINLNDLNFDVNVKEKGKYFVHTVTVTNLKQNTEYYFRIGNGFRYWGSSVLKKTSDSYTDFGILKDKMAVKTLVLPDDFNLVDPNPSYGYVESDYADLYNNAYVVSYFYDTLNGIPKSMPLSAPFNEEGSWIVDVGNARWSNGYTFSGYDNNTVKQVIQFVIAQDGIVDTLIYEVGFDQNKPMDVVTITLNEEEKNSSLKSIVYDLFSVDAADRISKTSSSEKSSNTAKSEVKSKVSSTKSDVPSTLKPAETRSENTGSAKKGVQTTESDKSKTNSRVTTKANVSNVSQEKKVSAPSIPSKEIAQQELDKAGISNNVVTKEGEPCTGLGANCGCTYPEVSYCNNGKCECKTVEQQIGSAGCKGINYSCAIQACNQLGLEYCSEGNECINYGTCQSKCDGCSNQTAVQVLCKSVNKNPCEGKCDNCDGTCSQDPNDKTKCICVKKNSHICRKSDCGDNCNGLCYYDSKTQKCTCSTDSGVNVCKDKCPNCNGDCISSTGKAEDCKCVVTVTEKCQGYKPVNYGQQCDSECGCTCMSETGKKIVVTRGVKCVLDSNVEPDRCGENCGHIGQHMCLNLPGCCEGIIKDGRLSGVGCCKEGQGWGATGCYDLGTIPGGYNDENNNCAPGLQTSLGHCCPKGQTWKPLENACSDKRDYYCNSDMDCAEGEVCVDPGGSLGNPDGFNVRRCTKKSDVYQGTKNILGDDGECKNWCRETKFNSETGKNEYENISKLYKPRDVNKYWMCVNPAFGAPVCVNAVKYSREFDDISMNNVGTIGQVMANDLKTEDGVLVINDPGLYSAVLNNGVSGTVVADSADYKVAFFKDLNGNGQYDSSDEIIDASANVVSVKKESDVFTYEFSEGYNFVSFPFVGDDKNNIKTMSATLKYLNSQGIEATAMATYDAGWKVIDYREIADTDIGSEGALFGVNDRPINPGKGYVIRVVSGGGKVTLTGYRVNQVVPVELAESWNLISVQGLSSYDGYTADDMFNSMKAQGIEVEIITQWKSGMYKSRIKKQIEGKERNIGEDFPVEEYKAYFVYVTKKGTWDPGK